VYYKYNTSRSVYIEILFDSREFFRGLDLSVETNKFLERFIIFGFPK